MSTQPPPDPVLLGDVIGTKEWVWAYCLDCHHDRFFRPEEVPLPPEFPIHRISERMTCSACGSREVHTKTSACWPNLDPARMLAPSFHEHGRLMREQGKVKGVMEP